MSRSTRMQSYVFFSSAATAVEAVGADGHLVPHPRQLEAHQLLQRRLVVGEQQLQTV